MSHAVYAGLGNTFVIAFDALVDTDEARRICAAENVDGIITASAGTDGADLTMVLYNADGSRAEISGNGLACLGQAAVDAERVDGPDVVVDTDAGRRRARVDADRVTVELGEPSIKPLDDGSLFIDVGNPHRVFSSGDVLALGRQHPDVNVEVIGRRAGAHIEMVVHERGVGLTDACGSGAYASAVAARHWGWVGDAITVYQPGGIAVVDLAARTYQVEVTRCR